MKNLKGAQTKTTEGTDIVLVKEVGCNQWLVEPLKRGGTTLCDKGAIVLLLDTIIKDEKDG